MSRPIRVLPGVIGPISVALTMIGALASRIPMKLGPVSVALPGPAAEGQRPVTDAWQRVTQAEQFVADLAHDLRSGLTAALSALELLTTRRAQLDARGQEVLDLLAEEMQQQRRLLAELLELGRAQARDADAGPTALVPAVRDTTARQRHRAPVEVQAGASDVCVPMHPLRIGRILANLLDNADRHAGGATALHVGRTGDRAWVAVEDAGPGVPRDAREHIFARFRAGPAPGGRPGSHLGLALCREHARQSGGDLLVEGRHGGGARFVLVLPVAEPSPSSTSPGTTGSRPVPGVRQGDAAVAEAGLE